MARTIYQRIALEGGKGIADELRKIGKDGEAAFIEIRGAAAKLSKDLGSVGKAFSDLGGSLATVGKRLGIAGGAVIGAAAGITALVGDAASAAKEIENLARVAGASPEEFQRLAAGAQTVGVEQDKLADILKDTQDKVGDFLTTGGGPLADFFEQIGPKIGVTAEQFRNLSGPQALQLYISSLEKANLSTSELTFFMEALASDSTLLLPLLRNNGREMARFGDEAARTGAILDNQALAALSDAGQSLRELGGAIGGARLQIASLLAPSVSAGADALTNFIAENRKALQDWVRDIVRTTGPIITDFIAVIQGRDADVGSIWVLKATVLYLKFSIAIEKAVKEIIIPAFRLLIDAADTVAEAFNKVFGTDFTGQQLLIAAAIAKLVGLFGVLSAAITVVVTAFTAIKTAFGFISLLTQSGIAFSILTGIVKGLALALGALVSIPGLIIAALVAAAAAIYIYWDEVSAAAGAAWEFIKGVWNAAPQFFNSIFASAGNFVAEQFNAIGTSLSAVWETIKQGGAAAIEGIKAAFSGAGEFLNTVFIGAANAVAEALQGIATAAAGIWQDVSTTATAAIAGLVESANALWGSIATSAQNQLAGLVQIFSNLNASLAVVWDAIRNGATSVFSFIRDGFTNVVSFVGNLFDGLASRIERVWNRIKSIIASAKAQYNQINDNNTGTGSQRDGVPAIARASGGMVYGPGTGTSDSIMARLSNGEFVVRAAAVRKYGPQFLAAINAMRFKMPKFATGGMVSMPKMPRFNVGGLVDSLTTGMQYQVPRFAEGGMVAIPAQAQGRPVTLNIDGRTFDGLTASEKTAEDLSRYATNRRLKSAGRKPGWVGG